MIEKEKYRERNKKGKRKPLRNTERKVADEKRKKRRKEGNVMMGEKIQKKE